MDKLAQSRAEARYQQSLRADFRAFEKSYDILVARKPARDGGDR